MKKIRCFECGTVHFGDWVLKNTKRVYEGEGYHFELEAELPYCKKCGSLLYDHDLEQKLREEAHKKIQEQLNNL